MGNDVGKGAASKPLPTFLASEAEARAWGFTDEQIEGYKRDRGLAATGGGSNVAAKAEDLGDGSANSDAVVIGRRILATMRQHHMNLTSVFHNFDDDQSNSVSLDEMAKGFRECGDGVTLTDWEAETIFEKFDADGSGSADVKELKEWFESLEDLDGARKNVVKHEDAPKGFYQVSFFNFDAKAAEERARAARGAVLERIRQEQRAQAKAARAAMQGSR